MSVIDDVAKKLGKPAGSVGILDLMNHGVPAAQAMREVSNRAQDQTTGKAPSAPPVTPPGWSWTPQPTQPAIDLGGRMLPGIPVPTYNAPPATSQRQPTASKPSGSTPIGNTPPPSASVPTAPVVPTTPVIPQLPQLNLNSPGGNNLLLWGGLGFLVLLVMGRR